MTSEPPRVAVSLVEMVAPTNTVEGVLGDLEEEFVGRLDRSGHRVARRWYWRQALRTTVHLLWGTVRAAPWSTTALVVANFIGASLLYGVVSGWLLRRVGQLPIYDYDTAMWSWRVAAAVRLIFVPLALGWSIAVVARGRAMVITTLVAGLLVAILCWNVAILTYNLSRFGPTMTPAITRLLFQVLPSGTTFPLGLVIGGMLRHRQQLRATRSLA